MIPCLIKFKSINATIGEKSNIPIWGSTRFIGSSIGSVISIKNLVIELLVYSWDEENQDRSILPKIAIWRAVIKRSIRVFKKYKSLPK